MFLQAHTKLANYRQHSKERGESIVKVTIKELKKWGNSTGIRFSQSELAQLGVDNPTKLQLTINKGTITLVPISEKPKSLDDLFMDYKGDVLGGSYRYDWDEEFGREIL